MEQFVVFRQKRTRTEDHKSGKNRQTYILKHLCISVVLFCVATFFLSADYLFGSEYSGSSESVNAEADESLSRYRVFSLRYISAEQGQKFLTEAGIGTISRLPGANALLVTARSHELMKASAIVKLIDSEQPYVMKTILPASQAQELPAFDKIAAEAGNISIGTFSDPPGRTKAAGVIIDIHNDVVIAVAPESRVVEIVSAIERLQSGEAQTLPPAEPNEPAEEEKDELFNNLLSALEEVKKREVPSRQVPAVAEQPEPNERAFVPERIEEPAFEPVKQPKEADLVAEAEETVGEMKAEPEQELELQPPVGAVQPYEPEPIAGGEDTLKLDLPEKMSIHDFLSFVGEHLHLDYLYDPTKVKGDVTLRLHGKLRGDIKVKELYPLLESVMKFNKFVMTRKGNLITIVPAGEALDIDPVLLPEKDRLELGDVIITRIFKLQHIDTGSAQNLLTAMKLGSDIRAIAETGTLIVTGYAYRMARVEELLQMIDKPGKPKEFRFRQLKYTMAKTLVPKVKTLAEQLGTISISIAAPTRASVSRRPGESAEAFRKRQAQARTAQAAGVKPTPARPTVYLDADERTNRILMIGLEEQLSVVDELINTLDVEQQDLRTMRLYEIQNVGADEVRRKLEELGIVGRGPVTTQRITAPAKAAPSPTRAVSAAEPLVEQPQIVIIESTNSLLVNGTAEQHAQVAMIIAYVDSETLLEAIPYKIYPLENQKPSDLATVLQQLVQETIKDKAGKIEKVVKKGEDITIIPDDNTFSLIVHASKKNQEWLGNLIKTLDKRRPQVLIDVTLVAVNRTDLFDFDLELASKFPVLEAGGTMDKVGSVLTTFLGEKTSEVYSAPGSAVKATAQGFYHDEHIQALLTAIQTKSYGRVLSKPKILVNDGQAGTIQSTEITNIQFTDTVVGVGEKPDRDVVRWQAYPAGITLTITPNISEGDLLLLDVKLTQSDFEEPPSEGAPPDKTETDVQTVVTVPDGRTIILGGLVKLNQGKGGTKVPLLGDIPLVGGLFRSISTSDRDSKLYVFVKANILRPDETLSGLPELERISQRNKLAFEKFEKRFQEYENWPGIKPEPMDPLKVLEAE